LPILRSLRLAPMCPRTLAAYRAFRTPLRRAFSDFRSPYVSVDVLLSWRTSRVVSVPVRHDPRREGRSGYTYRALATHALNVVTGFTTRPLRALSLIGLTTMLFSVGVLVYVLVTSSRITETSLVSRSSSRSSRSSRRSCSASEGSASKSRACTRD
jgi:hypothetical protein